MPNIFNYLFDVVLYTDKFTHTVMTYLPKLAVCWKQCIRNPKFIKKTTKKCSLESIHSNIRRNR